MVNLRSASRVVALSPNDRVLLVHFELKSGSFWATPGGGVEGDESRIDAARRELVEETGITNVELSGPIWERTHHFPLHGFDGQNEQFFLARTPNEDVAPLFSTQELLDEGVTTHRWWSVTEIQDSSERFAPVDLGTRIDSLLTDGPPETLIVLPDQHPKPTKW